MTATAPFQPARASGSHLHAANHPTTLRGQRMAAELGRYYLDNSKTSAPWQGWRVESMVVQPSGAPTHWQPFPPAKATA